MIEINRVSQWLESHIEGLRGPFEFNMITGGRSNITYRVVDAAGTQVVLRRPPTGHVLATAHDMAREYRIISAVGKTPVPVPKTLGTTSPEKQAERSRRSRLWPGSRRRQSPWRGRRVRWIAHTG